VIVNPIKRLMSMLGLPRGGRVVPIESGRILYAWDPAELEPPLPLSAETGWTEVGWIDADENPFKFDGTIGDPFAQWHVFNKGGYLPSGQMVAVNTGQLSITIQPNTEAVTAAFARIRKQLVRMKARAEARKTVALLLETELADELAWLREAGHDV
jgi:hypothetical protein